MLRPRIRFAILWIAALALGAALAPAPAAAQQPPAIDVSHIPGATFVAIVARPRQVLTSPDLKWIPTEVISTAGQLHLGIEPADIKQAIGFVALPPGGLFGGQLPLAGAVLRFERPYKSADILPALRPQMAEAKHAGKDYLRGPRPEFPAVAFVNDKTLFIGTEPAVQAMLETAKAEGPALDLLKRTDPTVDASLLFDLDPIRPIVAIGLASMPPPPAEFVDFLKIPQLVSALELHVNFRPKQPTTFVVRATDEAAAGELEQLLQKGVVVARQQILQNLPPADPADPVSAATRKYIERISGRISEWIKPVRKGADLTYTITANSPQGATATVGVLTALLLPAVQSARAAAQRAQSMNNLKQIALAMFIYESAHKTFPPRASLDKQGKPLLSWRVLILPYLEQQALYDRFRLDEPWDSEHNRKLLELMPDVYRAPGGPETGVKTCYLVPVGKQTIFGEPTGMKIAAIRDGTSNTILAVEADLDRAVEWTKPDDLTYDPERPLAGLGHLRPNGFNAAFADGYVRFLSNSIDLQTLRGAFTASGREVVQLED